MDDVNPHPVDENPEDHIGEAMLDPWNDVNQTDWPAKVKPGDEPTVPEQETA